jgi:integration host factor subunit beta
MTRADLTEEVSRAVGISRREADTIVTTMLDSIARSLRSGERAEIRGFGSFGTRQRKSRIGRNPKTGARVEVPAKRIPFFKPSKELKNLVDTAPVAVE